MDLSKHQRQRLVPVFPEASVYRYHCATAIGDDRPSHLDQWTSTVDPKNDGRVHYLKKHAEQLADFCVVGDQSPELIERIIGETGKMVVPTVTVSTPEDMYDDRGHPLEKYHDPESFVATAEQQAWIDYVTEHVDRWPWVMLVTSCLYDTIGSDFIVHPVMKKLLARFPQFAHKMAFGLWHEAIDYEATTYRGRLDESPLLNFLLAHNSLCMVYMGLDVLFPDVDAMTAAGYTTGILWHHTVAHEPPFDYPFEHLREFHRRLNARAATGLPNPGFEQSTYYARPKPYPASFSGIGFSAGGKNHHLAKLVEWGYSGACFFLPADISPGSDQMMEDYLTDIWDRDAVPLKA